MFKFKNKRSSWQLLKKNSACKAELIQKELQLHNVKSILDIGTNAGAVSRLLSENYFVVGIDQKIDTRGYEYPLKNTALGEIEFNLKNAKKIPKFDVVLLLSVHHQFYANLPEREADELVRSAINIAKKVVFIEFAALNSKYSFIDTFLDNDEESVLDYAFNYLNQLQPHLKTSYLGKCPESDWKPFRFIFMIEKLTSTNEVLTI